MIYLRSKMRRRKKAEPKRYGNVGARSNDSRVRRDELPELRTGFALLSFAGNLPP